MSPLTRLMLVPSLLSFNAGFVDTAGFLALQGLFTAHVTGNFVTLGASTVLGVSGAVSKLLALPVFCLVVIVTRLFSSALIRRGHPSLAPILIAKIVLLIAGAILAIRLGPFTNADHLPAIMTGMTFVAAMSVQNTVHRIHLASAPPTTLMTGTTTQVMIDIADLMQSDAPITRDHGGSRLLRMSTSVACFAAGCGCAAILYAYLNVWSFAVPPVVAVIGFLVRSSLPPEQDPSKVKPAGTR